MKNTKRPSAGWRRFNGMMPREFEVLPTIHVQWVKREHLTTDQGWWVWVSFGWLRWRVEFALDPKEGPECRACRRHGNCMNHIPREPDCPWEHYESEHRKGGEQ